jgi:RNA polymerase sigma factor for flagellar operon FliA
MTPKDLFLAHLPHIDNVVAHLCRKHHFQKEECEDFRSRVRVKLIEDDYGIIRKFQGRSSLKTYLTTVVSNEMKDFLNHLWGKWRPSTEAQRLGPVAIRLEKLLRDGLSVDEAVRTLQTNHKVEMSAQDLADLAARLPGRVPRRVVGEEALQDQASNDRADSRAEEEEREAIRRKVLPALQEIRKALPPEDQLILRMKGDDFKIADISRILGLEQKPLYRRIERLLKDLREELERRGFSKEDIDGIFDDDG